MKRYHFAICASLWLPLLAQAQGRDIGTGKPALDTSILYHWPTLQDAAISDDGQYALYSVDQQPRDSRTLVVCSTGSDWRLAVPGGKEGKFSAGGKFVLYKDAAGDLVIVRCGAGETSRIPNTATFEVFRYADKAYFACRRENGDFLLGEPQSDSPLLRLTGVRNFQVSTNGRSMAIVKGSDSAAKTQELYWWRMGELQPKNIWSGGTIKTLMPDEEGAKLAFIASADDGKNNAIWLYQPGMEKSELLFTDATDQAGKGDAIANLEYFSRDGSRLLFMTRRPPLPKPPATATAVDIWSYADPVVQSGQINRMKFWDEIRLNSVSLAAPHRIVPVQPQGENLLVGVKDDLDRLITWSSAGEDREASWTDQGKMTYHLRDLTAGTLRDFTARLGSLSPSGRYLVYPGPGDFSEIYLYDIRDDSSRCLTCRLPVPMRDSLNDFEIQFKGKRTLWSGNWYAGDKALLVYDRYDVWKLDPQGVQPPICLTNGYGRRHRLTFRSAVDWLSTVSDTIPLLLSAFDESTKDNGFYRVNAQQGKDPEQLVMGPYGWYAADHGIGAPVVKAVNAAVYLVRRENSNQSPNLYVTRDFRSFKQLSQVEPERHYNWLTSGLIDFRALDGRRTQAILFKPESFDPTKKYPVILHYYERRSHELHQYYNPGDGIFNGQLNIPWFVSHGYLVCVVDIDNETGHPGRSALDAVAGAAAFLKKFPYVDGAHLGIQGHSWAGFETYYLVTHSHLFAAACASSGLSDIISSYLLLMDGSSNYYFSEEGQIRMGATLWNRPDLFIENSAIFSLPAVTAPVLVISNKQDFRVPYNQGTEFFEGMRRLGKPCWMLQYDHGGHGLYDEDRLDYILRTTQFFDYYLKGARCPRWMAEGIPAKLKGIEDRLELEPAGVGPGPGLLTPQQQRKADSLMQRSHRPIRIRL